MLVLGTLGAPQRRFLGRRARNVERAEPEPVPTARATLVQPRPFASRAEADAWLGELRGDRDKVEAALNAACKTLNRAVHAHRVALAVLKPGQWSDLLEQLRKIDNPVVPTKPSKYALPAKKPKRASPAHQGE